MLEIIAALLVAGCSGQTDPEGEADTDYLSGKVSLNMDRDIIRADGNDSATMSVMLTDDRGVVHDVTADADIYCLGSDAPLDRPAVSLSESGIYTYYAVYGLGVSDNIVLTAVDGLDALPDDPSPDNLAFAHRMLLIQHTGTACPNCPRMMTNLKYLSEDEAYSSLYHHVASHSYNMDDDAYSASAALLSRTVNTTGYYPWLTFNLTEDYAHDLDVIKTMIGERHKSAAEVGISVVTACVDGKLYADVALKSAVQNEYRVAVWLLEDNISGVQSGADASWQHLHNNCLREMAGAVKTERIYGKSIGAVGEGETVSRIYALQTEDDWKIENLEVVVIATTDDGKGAFDVANCTVCPVGGKVEYEYN